MSQFSAQSDSITNFVNVYGYYMHILTNGCNTHTEGWRPEIAYSRISSNEGHDLQLTTAVAQRLHDVGIYRYIWVITWWKLQVKRVLSNRSCRCRQHKHCQILKYRRLQAFNAVIMLKMAKKLRVFTSKHLIRTMNAIDRIFRSATPTDHNACAVCTGTVHVQAQ